MEVDKSMKLIFNEFQRAVTEVPLEVYYQTVTADQYNSSGFQFNIKQPGMNALLDCDIWVKYTLMLRSANSFVANIFSNPAGAAANAGPIPQSNNRIALRGGNCISRCLQNLSVQINNSTLNVQPYKYIDVLNRVYVSNDQSEHEFSASGGRFDEGNHGTRTDHVVYETFEGAGANFANTTYTADNGVQHQVQIYLINGYAANPGPALEANDRTVHAYMRPPYPLEYEFYNPGFARRFSQFAYGARASWPKGPSADITARLDFSQNPFANAAAAFSMYAAEAINAIPVYSIDFYERLPIPIFKMYSTDGTYGVIPNVNQMQIQGNFLSNMLPNLIRMNVASADVTLNWDTTQLSTSNCVMYLRWFTPPVNYSIPRELSIPYPKINTWSKTQQLTQLIPANPYVDTQISEYNITLEAIPDLLLIYVKYSPFNYTVQNPDDYLLEIKDLVINIDNASGKLNQIQTIDLYQKWKKIIKHQDAKIITYEEWRKYCCVACLQPEDYGVRFGPGYSNQTVLGFKCTARNWHNNPTVMNNITPYVNGSLGGGVETMGGADGTGRDGEIFVTSIYNKNRFIIRGDGTANQELMKIAADFNQIAPIGVLPPSSA